jgi:hypothetical protein
MRSNLPSRQCHLENLSHAHYTAGRGACGKAQDLLHNRPTMHYNGRGDAVASTPVRPEVRESDVLLDGTKVVLAVCDLVMRSRDRD